MTKGKIRVPLLGDVPRWAVIIAIIGIIGFLTFTALEQGWIKVTPPISVLEEEELGDKQAYWKIYVQDYLDSSQTVFGTVSIYDPASPGILIETVALDGGVALLTKEHFEGKQLFCLYINSTSVWLRYGAVMTMPHSVPADQSTIPALYGGTMTVYKRGDFDVDADVEGLKNGDVIWDDSTVSLGGSTTGSFNVTGDRSDTDPPDIAIRVTNEDDNTAYVDPRGYYDYSVKDSIASLYADKASFMVVTFEKTGSAANVSDVADYVVWDGSAGGSEYKRSSTFLYLYVPLNTETLAGVREVVSGVTKQSGKLVTIWQATFDWPADMDTGIYTDDIDIEIAFVNNYAFAGIGEKIEQDNMEILGELGSSGSAWTNDWSIGDI